MVRRVLGLHGEYTKYPCFLCFWDSWVDDQHYVTQEWLLRQGLKPGLHNIQSHPLVELNKILLPPLQIKLGVMNFVKAMNRESSWFAFLQEKFPQISIEKLKAGIFESPQIRIHEGPNVSQSTKQSWTVCQAVTDVSSYKLPWEITRVQNMKRATEEFPLTWDTNVSHTILSEVTRTIFSKNCGDLSEEQSERCHQDLHIMEERYQGWWDVNFLADYCWCLKWDVVVAKHRRKSLKRPFIHE